MAFMQTGEGVASCIFLVLYTAYLVAAVYVVFKKGIKTLYTSLTVFGLFRVAAQLCGIAFSKLGIEHWQWLVAYLVFGAEGYFMLILTSFHYVGHIQKEVFGESKIARRLCPNIKVIGFITYRWVFHEWLVVANVLVIVGGTMLTSIDADKYNEYQNKVNSSKGLRGAGQAIFLVMTVIVGAMALYAGIRDRIRATTLYLVYAAFPFLLVRGIYGVLSCFVTKMNYYQLSNYGKAGLSTYFVATEYCLATTMEFVAAVILLSKYYLYDEKVMNNTQVADEESKQKYEKSTFTIEDVSSIRN
ncbi:Piso0_001345 [Millerozyma farinosa CBS 7064]|uniref:Piso0_001345 protein n=1 Tax=Pichia sorbitophila (strain ATCC MYA-4447 / BCRC 22081 / CBS 7064 / NBRC 10061 / NRRL Y-12695) TaxID=559304 RepID=G8YMX3_PICSO|nr:Piso0_001345 [Millerozyma farinosa CBS 7064]